MLKILVAGGVSLLVTLIGTKFWIGFLTRRAYGQLIRSDGPTAHHVKRGTPTMGGVILLLGVVAGYLVWSGRIATQPQAVALVEHVVGHAMGERGRELLAELEGMPARPAQ